MKTVHIREEHPPCPVCNGNDADMPCAYPSQGAEGCLRDARLAQPVQKPVAYMVTGNLEDLLFFDLTSAETAADMNCGTLVPLYQSQPSSQSTYVPPVAFEIPSGLG